MYTLKQAVGAGCPNCREDVQTVQMLLKHSGFGKDVKTQFGVTGALNANTDWGIKAFQSLYVANEERPYRGCVYPGSATFRKLVTMALANKATHSRKTATGMR